MNAPEWVDSARWAGVLAAAGDPLPVAPVDAAGSEVPLVVVDRPEELLAGVALQPQFGRSIPALRGPHTVLRLVAEAPVRVTVDGRSPTRLSPGRTLSVDLSECAGELRLTVASGRRAARITLAVDPRAPLVPDETWPLPGGHAGLLRAPGHATLRCPLVVVEGFPGGHGFTFTADLLAQHGVLDALRSRGFDLFAVGLDDGTQSLTRNSAVVQAALAAVAERSSLPVTLLGWSRGGLLARHALCALEARSVDHRVETLITWDTPHRGAMTQLGVQWLVEHFAGELPALAHPRALLDSAANRELDQLRVGRNGHPVQDRRHRALAKLGWPARPRRVLVSSGRIGGRGTPQPGHALVHWRGRGGDEITLRALGGADGAPLASGRIGDVCPPPLLGTGLAAWDGAPGGRSDYPAQAAAVLGALPGRLSVAHVAPTCAVPTTSALDLGDAPELPVPDRPDLIACQTDQTHLVIDAPAATKLLGAIGHPFDPDGFDPHAPGYLANPFPTFDRFRRFAPVHPVGDGVWCFTAADCAAVLTDDDTFRKHPPGGGPPVSGPLAPTAGLPPSLFASDPPAHATLRAAVETPVRAALERVPALARDHARTLLAAQEGTECLELVEAYALPLPAAVLFDLLGLPDDPGLRATLITWQRAIAVAHDATQGLNIRLQGATCALALRGAFGALVDRHRGGAPQPGLIGALCDTFAAAGLPNSQLVGTLCDLVVAGFLSTTFIIATGLLRLLEFPAELARVRADPSLADAAVDELLRMDGPVTLVERFAARDTSLDGAPIPAGTRVLAVVASAGRDPACHADPDQLRLDRDGSSLAFGVGIHHCVGAPIIRAVAPMALAELLATYPAIELDGEAQWQTDPYLHAVVSLPLRVRR